MSHLIFKEESFQIIGACYEVHKELGAGFLEAIYQEALECEFLERGIPYKKEVKLKVNYKGKSLKKEYFADFICYDKIIIELKALDELAGPHESQVINYLKATNLELGLLINFGQSSLKYKRLVRLANNKLV